MNDIRPMCATPGCTRHAKAKRGGYCDGCKRWFQRHPGALVRPPTREYGVSARERMVRAALRLADAEGDEEFDKAQMLFLKYAQQRAQVRMGDVVKAVVDALHARLERDIRTVARVKKRRNENVARRPDSSRHGRAMPLTNERTDDTERG